MNPEWLPKFRSYVVARPLVTLRFGAQEWAALGESRSGTFEFSTIYLHDTVAAVKPPAACIIDAELADGSQLYLASIRSKAAVSTLHSRLKIVRCVELQHGSLGELVALIDDKSAAGNLRRRIESDASVVPLSPVLSGHIIDSLGRFEGNLNAMQVVFSILAKPTAFNSIASMQEDGVRAALDAFGIGPSDALTVDVVAERETALARLWIAEDTVIEHDARSLPGYKLVDRDLTGRATFMRDGQFIEIITANKLPLEELFGVDLIIINLTHANVVMMQYKMLEPEGDDWIYRPDSQLEEEIARMKVFDRDLVPGSNDYRFNTDMFYLKWVRRDKSLGKRGILTPLGHFDVLRNDPACRGPRGGFRITFDSLGGRYLREPPFLELVRAGYIGSRATTTDQVKPLIEAALQNNRAVIAAVRSHRLHNANVKKHD